MIVVPSCVVCGESEIWLVYGMIERHQQLTQSALAKRVLSNWENLVSSFVKVMPVDYRKVLESGQVSRLRPPAPKLKEAG